MNRNRLGICALGIMTLGVVACLPAAVAGDATAGKSIYESKCMICHGRDGASATGYAKALALEPAQLGSDRVQKKSDADIRKVILEGSGKMKPVKGLSDLDIANVIAYVRTLAKK